MKAHRVCIFVCLFAFLKSFSASAAANDSIWVAGTLVDAMTGAPVEDADLVFMRPDSTVVSRGRPIDWCKKYGIDDGTVLITYNIPVSAAGKYIIRVSSPKYEEKYVDIEIPEKQYGKRPESWEVADIPLEKSYLLGEAVVRASRVMMVNKGDTVVYNASAFQLADGSMLDALIARLPGVWLTEDGQIFVNEQYVSCLLVNGEEFFQGNPAIALKNLPAYTVDKVKAYKRGDKADYLFRRDSTERLKDELVLDVALKKEYHGSWLANVDVGYGTDARYVARLFGLRFTNKSRLAAFANLNNVGMTQQPGEHVEHSAELLPVQPAMEKSGGVDFYATMGRRKITYKTVLTGSHRDENILTEVAANSILPGSQVFSRSRSSSRSCRTEVDWRNLLCMPLPKVYAEFTLGGQYGQFRNDGLSRSIELDALPYEAYRLAALDSVFGQTAGETLLRTLVNRYERQSRDNVRRHAVIGSGLSKWKAPLTGNPISLYAEMAYEKQSADNAAAHVLQSFPTPGYLNREQQEGNSHNDLKGKARLDYEYGLPAGFKLVAGYELAAQRLRSNRALDTLYILPDAGVGRLLAADFRNSYDRTLRRISHMPTLQFHYASPGWLVSVHFPVKITTVRLNERRLSGEAARPRRHYAAFEPSLTINSNKGLAFSYNYREEEPNMVYLTGLQDTSEPLSVMLGNTALHNKGLHTAGLNYSRSDGRKMQNWGLAAALTVIHNETTLLRTYDAQTGISTYAPRNVNGNHDLQLNGSFSQAVDKRKRFFPEIITQFNWGRSVGYAGLAGSDVSSRIAMKSLTLAQQLGVKYQAGQVSLKLFARGEWLHGASSQPSVADTDIRKIRYAFVATAPLVWDIQLGADLSLYTLRGYEASSMNTNDIVLNASLSKSLLRDKSLTLQVTGFDLFDRIKNIRQSVNAQGRIETWSNTLRRYVMFHLIYRFGKQPRS